MKTLKLNQVINQLDNFFDDRSKPNSIKQEYINNLVDSITNQFHMMGHINDEKVESLKNSNFKRILILDDILFVINITECCSSDSSEIHFDKYPILLDEKTVEGVIIRDIYLVTVNKDFDKFEQEDDMRLILSIYLTYTKHIIEDAEYTYLNIRRNFLAYTMALISYRNIYSQYMTPRLLKEIIKDSIITPDILYFKIRLRSGGIDDLIENRLRADIFDEYITEVIDTDIDDDLSNLLTYHSLVYWINEICKNKEKNK